MRSRILFVCIHNSARSQMAEAFLNQHCAGRFAAVSAGIEPGTLNANVIAVMRERGIDISGNTTKSVAEMMRADMTYEYVITVCDEASAERCPVFPATVKRLHWGFPDPSSLPGTPAERLARTREIRDQIERRIEAWCAQHCSGESVA